MNINRKVALLAGAAVVGLGPAILAASGAAVTAHTGYNQAHDTGVLAQSWRPRPLPPTSPRGLGRSGVERPDQARTPRTGPR
ncbi:hypothetical protein ACFQU9_14265 [Actinomadura namibiensis]|uniref:Uncharacterized protein n=1 Tax=Actinomadura namibiensis TaxID=182080 RepID=A0A7W3M018_ACTNM|nr:hypothetical protein [Actinomadura namibiensis]MBA8957500.1 hypothetical protein [Actinomadura namibiensis]